MRCEQHEFYKDPTLHTFIMADEPAPISYEDLAAIEDDFSEIDTEMSTLARPRPCPTHSDLPDSAQAIRCLDSYIRKTSRSCNEDREFLEFGAGAGPARD